MRQPGALLVKRTCGVDNVVADDLSRMFEDESSENPEIICATMLGSLPLIYSSFQKYKGNDAFCNDLRGKVEIEEASAKITACTTAHCVISPRRRGGADGLCHHP